MHLYESSKYYLFEVYKVVFMSYYIRVPKITR
nr:MAG TPA: hypothetical protein [Caudoviricetes sp.]